MPPGPIRSSSARALSAVCNSAETTSAIAGLSSDAANPGTLTIENASATPATLTVTNATAQAFRRRDSGRHGGRCSGLTKAGRLGTLTLGGATANTFTGMTTVTSGSLILDKAGADVNAIGGDITIDWTAQGTSALLLAPSTTANVSSSELPTSATITFTAGTKPGGSGDFSVDGHNVTIAGIIAQGTGNNNATNQKVNLYNRGPSDTTAAAGTLTIDTPSGAYYLANISSIADAASGSGSLAVTKTGDGTQGLIVSQFSSTGPVTVEGGALQILFKSLPKANLVLDGGVLENYAAQGVGNTGSFSLRLGTAGNQFRWTGDGGFAAYGGSISVNVGATGIWGSTANFLPDGATLMFGSETSNSVITYTRRSTWRPTASAT